MNIGSLNRKITLQMPDKNTNSFGESVITWVSVGEIWADVQPLSGRESFSSDHRYATVTHRFKIRFRTDVTPEYQVLYQGQYFDIKAVLEMGRREGLEILAEATDQKQEQS
jgi:SPP1 family predicted phage head-tail adaptor